MQDKDFDQLFKQRFDELEVEPSSSSWGKITEELDGADKRINILPSYWMAAASVVLLASAILLLYKPVDVIKLRGKPQGEVTVIKNHVENNSPLENQIVDATSEVVTAPPVGKKSFLAARKADKVDSKDSKSKMLQVTEEKARPLENQVLLAKQEIRIVTDNEIPVATSENNPVVLAQMNDEIDESPVEAETSKPRIKSIGGLVNFVIAQVDKRDDKIIEFEDGQEGSQVSGINLGPLKFKSRKQVSSGSFVLQKSPKSEYR